MSTDPNVRRYYVLISGSRPWGHVDFVRIVEVHDDDLHWFVGLTDREREAYATNHGKRPEIEEAS